VTSEELAQAEQAMQNAQRESSEATGDYVRYQATKPNPGRNNPGDPSYSPEEAAVKEANMLDKFDQAADARVRFEQVERAAAAQRASEGSSRSPIGPSRGLPGCPPNCGNDNKTGAQNIQAPGDIKSLVGAAGVSKVLGGQ
jgi:hypothetical protein